jgi:4-amino-4-deoxy-L-arabinose transferase-like glycosyltransferase
MSSARTTWPERLFSRNGLIAAWVLLVLVQLPIRDVMPPDESRFAQQAQSMKMSGEWIVPHIGDVENVEKPPVLFWAVVIASLPFDRVTETTSRVPSAIGALIVLLLAVRLGRRLWGSDVIAYGAALITLTGIEFFQKAQWCSCDMPMAAFAWTAIILWSEAAFGDPPPGRPALRIVLGWAAVGFGILTKGPVAFLWVLFWVVAEAIARRRFRPLVRLAWNPGVVIACAIVGGWLYALGVRAGWPFVQEAVIHQALQRYAHAWNSVHPWWFYAYQTPSDLLPWVAFLPAAIAMAMRRGTAQDGERSTIAARALALFVLFALLFLSSTPGKRGVYVMEAFPAISLLIAAAVMRAGLGRIGFVLMVAIGLVLGVGAPLAIASGVFAIPGALAAAAGVLGAAALVVGGLAISAGAGFGLALLRRGRNESALASAVVGTVVALILAGTVGGATWSRLQGARPFCETMNAAAPPGERIAVEGTKFEQFMFYTLRKTTEFNDDRQLVDILASGRCRYAIMLRQRYQRLRGVAPVDGLSIRAEGTISGTDYVLVGPAPR